MNRFRNMLIALVVAIGLALSVPMAWAGEGHDHGEAPAAAGGPALPPFTAVSELFELVGVVNGKQITLYLDRFADGSPVKDAKLELELGGIKIPVESQAEGELEPTLAQELNVAKIGRGGSATAAKPLGVFVIRDGGTTWVPAVDADRIAEIGVVTGLLTAVIGCLAILRRPPWPDVSDHGNPVSRRRRFDP